MVWRYPPEPILRFTKILNVTGDFDALSNDITNLLKSHMQSNPDYSDKYVHIRIHEPNQCLYVKGHWKHVIIPYLLEQGF